MGRPHRFETGQDRSPEPEAEPEAPVEDSVGEISEPEELKVRLAIKNRHIQELYDELAGTRLSADEVRAVREVGQREISALEEDRDGLQKRVRELERELQGVRERAAEADELRQKLEEEYERRRRLAEPENRLRAGVELFNESEHRDSVNILSRSMGQPEAHVALEEGEEPAVVLDFTWQGITWQTYASNPSLAVQEPRVYLESSGEDLSGVETKPPNAHVGAGGRVLLGV